MDSAAQPSAPQVEVAPAPVEHAPALGVSMVEAMGPYYALSYTAISASYHFWTRPGVELSAGGRLGFSSMLAGPCGEGFIAAALVPHFRTLTDDAGRTGSWRPSLGIELGVSTARPGFPASFAPEDVTRGTPPPDLVYAQLVARPLRFRLTHFNASALGLGLGTTLGTPGRYTRLQIELLQIGFVL